MRVVPGGTMMSYRAAISEPETAPVLRCALHDGPLPAICPRCDGRLLAFSPSGKGVAACDECSTYWDECPCCKW